MKQLFSTILLISSAFSFGQIPQPIDAGETEEKKPRLCRDNDLRMVQDCGGYVYSDFMMVEGRDEEVVFHSKSGKPFTGECKVCYNNGYLKMHLEYSNGRLIGIDTVYYENGNVNLITSHDNLGYGKEDGTWKYYREDGSLKWEKNYSMGMAEGEHRFYFADTTLQKIEVYKNNQLHGKKQEFYPNQAIKKEIDYKNGMWDGTYITYFKDGKVESEQQFVNDLKDGPSSYYYENGNLFYTENHEKGSREGQFKRMYATGRMWTKESYKKNVRDGEFEEYYDNEKNTIKYKATYKKGMLTYEMYYDEFGGEVMSPERIQEIQKNKELEEQDGSSESEPVRKKNKRK